MNPLYLPKDTIHIWYADLALSSEQLDYLWPLLSVNEQQRALRFKFDVHRQRFIAAKGKLRLLLSRYLQQDPAAIEFTYNSYGKPFLLGQKNPPLFFNSTDSHQAALFAISDIECIGVDIEYIRENIAAVEIAERFFSTEENDYLKKLDYAQQQINFFKIWTLKEAFIKALGLGLSFPLKDFSVAIEEEKTYLTKLSGENLQKEDWSLHSFAIDKDFMAALAWQGAMQNLDFFDFAEW